MQIKVKKLRDDAVMPFYGTSYSAGADLSAAEDFSVEIGAGKSAFIHTGISLEIPAGFVGLIFARSSLGTKQGLAPANKVGVIDSDYRGEIMVCLHNHSSENRSVEPGQRIAQLVIVPYLTADFTESEELNETVRGEGGFGSTGD